MNGEEALQAYARGIRDFRWTDLKGAQLPDARLEGANLEGADLRRANLDGAELLGVDIRRANLEGANLEGANLEGSNLEGANLQNSTLCRANLERANLREANLTNANLEHTSLVSVNFNGARLEHVSVGKSMLGRTLLVDVDLSSFCRGVTNQESPSVVDYRSILRSLSEPTLKDFLRRIGMPDVFVEYMVDCARSMDPQHVFSLLQSIFISYGSPDEEFASKLNEALEAQGVTTFFFKHDAPAGQKLHRVMRRGVNEHDRVVLICSRQSLSRPGVLNEVEETLAREARDGGSNYLIPVRLDNYVFDGWQPENTDLAQAIRDRVVVDFSRHDDPRAFKEGVSRLINVLRKPQTQPVYT